MIRAEIAMAALIAVASAGAPQSRAPELACEFDQAIEGVEERVISFVHEVEGVSKALVTVGNQADVRGYPAAMSEHRWLDGRLTVSLRTGVCRA